MNKHRKWLLHLYPRTWRNRYEDEFAALLEQCPFLLSDMFDIVRGAIDAHLHPGVPMAGETLPEGRVVMIHKLRKAMIVGFCAYTGFFVAGVVFEEMTNEDHFVAVTGYLSRYYTDFVVASRLLVIGFIIALLAVMVGGLPIGFAAIRRAASVARKDLLLFAVPLFSLGVLWAGGAFVVAVQDERIALPLVVAEIVYVAYMVLMVAGATVSTAAVSLAIARSEISEQFFQFALIPATIALLAMVLTLCATIAWGVSLSVHASWILTSLQYLGGDGRVFSTTTAAEWLGTVGVMAVSTAIAAVVVLYGTLIRATVHPSSAQSPEPF